MSSRFNVFVLPGDGIGPEVINVAVQVLVAAANAHDINVDISYGDLGGVAIDLHGSPLPQQTLARAQEADAVLVGAVGGPRWDALPFPDNPGGGGLLRLRRELDLFANLRPVTAYPASLGGGPVDLMIVREATGGIYFGRRGESGSGDARRAFDSMEYSVHQVRRVMDAACRLARSRRGRIVSVDKANVLASSRLWREVAQEVFEVNADLETSHMHVDNCAAQIMIRPQQFDVLVTENLFGDILSDQAAALEGSLGLAASASLNGGRAGLYEPVHGSAPDIAGQGIANPSAAIRSVALMFRYSLAAPDVAADIERALTDVSIDGVTADLAGSGLAAVSTESFGEGVLTALRGGLT